MRVLLLTVSLLGVVLLGLSAPQIQVDREIYDFGTASDGTVVEFFVTIANAGDQRLIITRVSYNCVCTSYELPKRELDPGETVKMRIRFNTTGYSRYAQPVFQTVTLYTNDPARPQVVITVRGTVQTLSAHEAPAKALSDTFYLLIDVREPEKFAQGHLFGAINIPLSELEGWVERLPKDRVIYLCDETGEKSAHALALLRERGFLLVRAIRGGLVGWWQELGDLFFVWPTGSPLAPQGSIHAGSFTVTPSQVARGYQVIVDVRRPEEFKASHLAGAINVPLFTQGDLVAWAQTLPSSRPGYTLSLWIVDEDGTRACSIATWLRNHGYPEAKCLFGGMNAWRAQFGSELLWTEG